MSITNTDTRIHLHQSDYPDTIAILSSLLIGHGATADKEVPGFEVTEFGAFVDWDELLGSYLSSTEKAVVHIARGIKIGEAHGGLPPRAHSDILRAVMH